MATQYIDRISPAGYHLPTSEELAELIASEFYISQSGIRAQDGEFILTSDQMNIWSAEEVSDTEATSALINNSVTTQTTDKHTGYIVRLVKDTDEGFVPGETLTLWGVVYRLAKIGNKVWMIDNLKSDKYNDGSSIEHVTDSAQWAANTTGAYCKFNNI